MKARAACCGLAVLAALAGCGGSDGGRATAATFSRSFGGPGHDEARAAIATSDGGYVFVGSVDPGDSISLSIGFGLALNPRFSISIRWS